MNVSDVVLLMGTSALMGCSVCSLRCGCPRCGAASGRSTVAEREGLGRAQPQLPVVCAVDEPAFGGCLLALAGSVLNVRWLVVLGAAACVLAVVPFVLHLMLNLVNRPGWLVPPRLRHQLGWLGAGSVGAGSAPSVGEPRPGRAATTPSE
jgi:hypothetical protein